MQSAVLCINNLLPRKQFSLKQLSLSQLILYPKTECIRTCAEWLICNLQNLEETVTKFRIHSLKPSDHPLAANYWILPPMQEPENILILYHQIFYKPRFNFLNMDHRDNRYWIVFPSLLLINTIPSIWWNWKIIWISIAFKLECVSSPEDAVTYQKQNSWAYLQFHRKPWFQERTVLSEFSVLERTLLETVDLACNLPSCCTRSSSLISDSLWLLVTEPDSNICEEAKTG